ncbi:MAG: glutamate 5-kinase, partial [bacterium]|nr:glutamate 5-kinase [bacterium]
IPLVQDIDKKTARMAEGTGRSLTSVGGMRTKLQAAKRAGKQGIPTLIANGLKSFSESVRAVPSRKTGGTLFLPRGQKG